MCWCLSSATRSRACLLLYKPVMLWGLSRAWTKGRAFGDRVFREHMALQKLSCFEVSKVSAGQLQGRT